MPFNSDGRWCIVNGYPLFVRIWLKILSIWWEWIECCLIRRQLRPLLNPKDVIEFVARAIYTKLASTSPNRHGELVDGCINYYLQFLHVFCHLIVVVLHRIPALLQLPIRGRGSLPLCAVAHNSTSTFVHALTWQKPYWNSYEKLKQPSTRMLRLSAW